MSQTQIDEEMMNEKQKHLSMLLPFFIFQEENLKERGPGSRNCRNLSEVSTFPLYGNSPCEVLDQWLVRTTSDPLHQFLLVVLLYVACHPAVFELQLLQPLFSH